MRYLTRNYSVRATTLHWVNSDTVPSIFSLSRLVERGFYHYDKLRLLLYDKTNNEVANANETSFDFLELILKLDEAIDPELAAMMQALRSQFEIFAQIINSELVNPKKEKHSFEVSFKKISKLLPDCDLSKKITNIIENPNFIYLDQFVNANKHIMVPGISWEFSDSEQVLVGGTKISEFQRDTTVQQSDLEWILETLFPWSYESLKEISELLKDRQVLLLGEQGEWSYN